ncbi:MAG: hypothetical protein ACREOK_10190 [Gemmatimonadaceae bacterium]
MATQKEEVSRYEWLAAGLGALVFIGLVGYFGRQALRDEAGPPDVAVQVDSISRASAGWIAHLSATNSGGSATSVRIVGELTRSDTVVETSDVTLDLLGRSSRQSAGLYFSRDPAQHALRVRPVSFVTP